MKKRMLYKLSWGILLAGLTACSDLTDSYKEYLDWGERVYAGKMDSVGVRPGRLRQQLDFFYTSPRLSRGVIYWNQKQDSLEFDIPADGSRQFSEIISPLAEGEYGYIVYTYDQYGNPSRPLEYSGRVYGPSYESILLTADLEKVENHDTQFYIKWKNVSEMEGMNLRYENKSGRMDTLFVPSSQAECTVDAVPGSEYSYTTIHRPGHSIDSLVSEAVIGKFPYYKTGFHIYNLPTNTPTEWGWNPENLCDGNLETGWHTGEGSGGKLPHQMTFELDRPTELHTFKIYQRAQDDWAFRAGNPKKYTLWGTNSLPAEDGSDEGWTMLGEFQSVKPSGLPVGTLTDADIAYARAGESYDIPEVGIFRYLRIKVLESWGGEQAVHFMELEFFGIPHEETGINDSNS